MFVPNLYTLKDRGKQYGLHKFQDGVVMLAIQHECGDWITLSRTTEAEVKYFEQYGEKVEKPRRNIELPAQLIKLNFLQIGKMSRCPDCCWASVYLRYLVSYGDFRKDESNGTHTRVHRVFPRFEDPVQWGVSKK